MNTLSCDYFPPIYKHLICGFFINTLIIVSISTNIDRPYECDPLGPYNFIDVITSYWSTFINYLYQHID